MFNKGEPIVCINDTREDYEQFLPFQEWVQENAIYHVRHIYTNDDIVTGILLEEVLNVPVKIKLLKRFQEPAFGLFRFRRLTEKEKETYNSLPWYQMRNTNSLFFFNQNKS